MVHVTALVYYNRVRFLPIHYTPTNYFDFVEFQPINTRWFRWKLCWWTYWCTTHSRPQCKCRSSNSKLKLQWSRKRPIWYAWNGALGNPTRKTSDPLGTVRSLYWQLSAINVFYFSVCGEPELQRIAFVLVSRTDHWKTSENPGTGQIGRLPSVLDSPIIENVYSTTTWVPIKLDRSGISSAMAISVRKTISAIVGIYWTTTKKRNSTKSGNSPL